MRFCKWEDAQSALRAIDGAFEDGCHLVVSKATNRKPEPGSRKMTNEGMSPAMGCNLLEVNHVNHNQVTDMPKKILEVICDACNFSWLSMSIVIILNEPMKHSAVTGLVKDVWDNVYRVIASVSTKAMVVFDSEKAMLQALSEGVESVSSFCYSMKPWSLQEWSFSRYT